jgi:hypothetical protein
MINTHSHYRQLGVVVYHVSVCNVQIKGVRALVVCKRMVFCKIVARVSAPGAQFTTKMFLLNAIFNPVKSNIHDLGYFVL